MLIALMTIASPISAQTTVKGNVVNERGESIEYVSIGFENDSVGIISDAKGHFELTIPAGRKTELSFTHVSYLTTEIPYQEYSKNKELTVVLKDKVVELLKHFLENKSMYGTFQNDEVYYNRETEINFNLSDELNSYDLIYIAIGVLLTQNRANFYVTKPNPSFSFNLILNLIVKFSQSLRLYDECIKVVKLTKPLANKTKFDFTLIKQDDKIVYKTETLEVEYDYNLLLQAYPIQK